MRETARAWLEQRVNFGLLLNLGPIVTYMIIFFGIPVGVFFVYSFWRTVGWDIVADWNVDNYIRAIASPVYRLLIARSVGIAFITAVLSISAVYPLAYAMAFKLPRYRDLLLFLLIVSLFSSYLVRVYAWRSLLSSHGLLNTILMAVGVAHGPRYYFLHHWSGVVLVLINVYIPIATLPIYSALLNIDPCLIDAAQDLGASPLRAFQRVTLPLSLPGVKVALALLVLITAGDFVTPELVGGINGRMIGNAIATQFGYVFNWPLGSALAFSTILALLLAFGALFLTGRLLMVLRSLRG